MNDFIIPLVLAKKATREAVSSSFSGSFFSFLIKDFFAQNQQSGIYRVYVLILCIEIDLHRQDIRSF